MDKIILSCDIIAKPRMTQRDKWQKRDCVIRYRGFCDLLRITALQNKFSLGDCVKIIFLLPIPGSWSKKRKQEFHNKPHQQKPDIDNLVKAVLDALNRDDSHIFYIEAGKYWTNNPAGGLIIKNLNKDVYCI